ncbi:MAG: diadenosine tetraphosphate hydrolase [Cycloclasticus sp. symbiont of Poecilosclerida sp. N]|nr:MAG: diadenosine tetraphosphate hydrolase [Cycloclasticus sp. symbiont of Poecilosclerida sp. N]
MLFKLHPRLAEDCYYLGDFPLSALLLSKDARYPWYILVPKQADISEAFQLSPLNQQQLQYESLQLSERLNKAYQADKMNISALGNMVPQLHLHHIVRYSTDPAWPNTVWGHSKALKYTQEKLEKRVKKTHHLLNDTDFTSIAVTT